MDPGIDHMLAMKCIDEAHDSGSKVNINPIFFQLAQPNNYTYISCFNNNYSGQQCSNVQVISFESFCGALPAPENSENVLRYKFSWSPRGVLLAHLNSAKYLKDGKIVEVTAGGALLDHHFDVNFMPGFAFVGYPNRDSTIYSTLYNIDGECTTLLRGTLRYRVCTYNIIYCPSNHCLPLHAQTHSLQSN